VLTVTLRGLASDATPVVADALDPSGPFELVRALRPLAPGVEQQVRVAYAPTASGSFFDELRLRVRDTVITVPLQGTALPPVLSITPAGPLALDACLAGDRVTRTLTLANASPYEVACDVTLLGDSSVPELSEVVAYDAAARGPTVRPVGPVGTRNLRSGAAWTVEPPRVVLAPSGGTSVVTVTFRPDHASDLFYDTLVVTVPGTPLPPVRVPLRALACAVPFYVSGTDRVELSRADDPLLALTAGTDAAALAALSPTPTVVLRHSLAAAKTAMAALAVAAAAPGPGASARATTAAAPGAAAVAQGGSVPRTITLAVVDSIPTAAVATLAPPSTNPVPAATGGSERRKVAADFTVEPLTGPDAGVFRVEPAKGAVTAATPRPLTITFAAGTIKDLAVGQCFEGTVSIAWKGDGALAGKAAVQLRAIVVP
jgi:hypothetical protein